jgi:hypothetical protein
LPVCTCAKPSDTAAKSKTAARWQRSAFIRNLHAKSKQSAQKIRLSACRERVAESCHLRGASLRCGEHTAHTLGRFSCALVIGPISVFPRADLVRDFLSFKMTTHSSHFYKRNQVFFRFSAWINVKLRWPRGDSSYRMPAKDSLPPVNGGVAYVPNVKRTVRSHICTAKAEEHMCHQALVTERPSAWRPGIPFGL